MKYFAKSTWVSSKKTIWKEDNREGYIFYTPEEIDITGSKVYKVFDNLEDSENYQKGRDIYDDIKIDIIDENEYIAYLKSQNKYADIEEYFALRHLSANILSNRIREKNEYYRYLGKVEWDTPLKFLKIKDLTTYNFHINDKDGDTKSFYFKKEYCRSILNGESTKNIYKLNSTSCLTYVRKNDRPEPCVLIDNNVAKILGLKKIIYNFQDIFECVNNYWGKDFFENFTPSQLLTFVFSFASDKKLQDTAVYCIENGKYLTWETIAVWHFARITEKD